jgi:thioredoxin-related protein
MLLVKLRFIVRSQDKTAQEETIGSCSTDTIRKLGADTEYRKGFFLFFSQPKCNYCDEMRRVIDSTVKTLKPIVEASLSDKECGKLADLFKIEITPTVLYFEGNEEKQRIAPDGKITWQDAEAEISKLAELSPSRSVFP